MSAAGRRTVTHSHGTHLWRTWATLYRTAVRCTCLVVCSTWCTVHSWYSEVGRHSCLLRNISPALSCCTFPSANYSWSSSASAAWLDKLTIFCACAAAGTRGQTVEPNAHLGVIFYMPICLLHFVWQRTSEKSEKTFSFLGSQKWMNTMMTVDFKHTVTVGLEIFLKLANLLKVPEL